jgi:Basic region leucine zipper
MKMPRKIGNGKKEITRDDPIYKDKRNKNNDAVKRSRQKTKAKAKETMDKVSRLKKVSTETTTGTNFVTFETVAAPVFLLIFLVYI